MHEGIGKTTCAVKKADACTVRLSPTNLTANETKTRDVGKREKNEEVSV